MRDGHDSCVRSGEGCLRCEVVSANTGKSGDTLLLAPLDGTAKEALHRQLTSNRLEFVDNGAFIELFCGSEYNSHTVEQLKLRLSPKLQERIKGVFVDSASPRSPESLFSVFMHAEPLSSLFESMEVEWARTVLTDGGLFSVYHPIVDARSGGLFAYEALIRARHPFEGDVVGAGRLIHACERLGLQNALDQSARVTALTNARHLDLSRVKLFMNFLPSSIYDPEICLRSTMEAAAACKIPLEQLVFEVIETEQVRSMDALRKIVQYYRARGCGIALDDISSGFASLQFLADLMPDFAKIDGQLVAASAESSSARHTLESIVGLAKKLEVKVIAEGIESIDQMNVCLEAGVDYMQGFLFALPDSPPQVVRLPESFQRAAAA